MAQNLKFSTVFALAKQLESVASTLSPVDTVQWVVYSAGGDG